MSSKPSQFDITGGRHERNCREFSVAGFIFTFLRNIFTYVEKYFSGPVTGEKGRGVIAPIAPPPVDPPLVTLSLKAHSQQPN